MMKKNKKKFLNRSDRPSGGGWEIIYSGFVLILLSFFIMLSSFSTMEEAKVMRFVRSFAKAVSILPGGLKFESGTAVLSDSPEMVDYKNQLSQLYKELTGFAGKLDVENEVDIFFSAEGLVMRLSDQVLFDLGVASLSPEPIPLLDKIGAVIAKTSYFIRIEGHTDNLPIHTEIYPSNWELSTARAVNVLRYFIENHKIDPHRLSAVGLGEFQPMVPNNNIEQRAKNRRVEIIFTKEDPGQMPSKVKD